MYELDICVLYPEYLNLYGDSGNVLILQKRMEWRGHRTNIHKVSIGDEFVPGQYDIIFISGGHDNGQRHVCADFNYKADSLKKTIEEEKVIFAICAGFQLLGRHYDSLREGRLEMSGILDFYTENDSPRCRGDMIVRRKNGCMISGYENHSGRTYLGKGLEPFGFVEKGLGNNGSDGTDGVHYKNTFGTYCHGPALISSPEFADELLRLALENKYGEAELSPLKDEMERKAGEVLIRRYMKK